ncbi:hypothetical protein [Vibrio parahaemolyticus]|uniref:hypothetical protein n=1 Tax=Vibrio parahaemolyticus TaxID=670 RepID=UPI001E509C1A|nr:hypothetical protein [Vibrio parahaemolyticus]
MDTLTFISTILGQVLSWPVAVFSLALIYRKAIFERLSDLKKLKTKHFEADFGEQLKNVEKTINNVEPKIPEKVKASELQGAPMPTNYQEYIQQLTELLPNAAVLESWRNVEATLDNYFSSRGIERPRSGQTILRYLDYDPNFPPKLVSAYNELRLLRNKAAHEIDGISGEQAKEFAVLASRLTHALVNAAAYHVLGGENA